MDANDSFYQQFDNLVISTETQKPTISPLKP